MFDVIIDLPFIYLLICCFVGFIYSFLLYRNNIILSKSFLLLLSLFRFICVTILCILLLNPLISNISYKEEKPVVILAQDASISCQDIDDYDKFIDLEDVLSDDFDVYSYSYSDDLYDKFDSIKTGQSTNISCLMDKIDLRFSEKNVVGVVMTSDGVYNQGINPLYHKSLRSYPFYTISLGDTSVVKDVRVSNVLYNEISFLDNISPFEVKIRSDKSKGEILRVSLYRNGKIIENQSKKITSDSDLTSFNFSVLNIDTGLQIYKVTVDEIMNERNLQNNSSVFSVDVIDSRYKILILSDVTHPDIGMITRILDHNSHYSFDFYDSDELPSDLGNYDLIVSFYLDNSSTINRLSKVDLPKLLFINSSSSFCLDSLYSSGSISSNFQHTLVTSEYNSSFSLFRVSDDLQAFLNDVPPVGVPFGLYKEPLSSSVLCYQKVGSSLTNMPLILLENIEEKKIGVIYGEGIWKWRLHDRFSSNIHQNINELFSKIFRYLLMQEDKRRFRVISKKTFFETQDIIFQAEYYNQSYELNNIDDVKHVVTNDHGDRYDFIYSKNSDDSYYLNIGKLSPGEYSYVSSHKNGEQVRGTFVILPKILESSFNMADHQILYHISQESNAVMFSDFNINDIHQTLIQSPLNKVVLHSLESVSSLINNLYILLFILILMCVEWISRKYHGFY